MNRKPQLFQRVGTVVVLLALSAGVAFWWWNWKASIGRTESDSPKNNHEVGTISASNSEPAPSVSNGLSDAQQVSRSAEFEKRPFAVALQSSHYEWTAEDGRDSANIRKLAHNDAEYQRMTNENNTIFRRQLVYQKNPFSLAAQRAVHFGETISQITLPALDGQELVVDVTKSEFESGGDKGVLTGKLAGRSDSMVVVAFAGGREGFTVVSPRDHFYAHAEPREPGEIIVKQIDPDTYGGELKDCVVAPPTNNFSK